MKSVSESRNHPPLRGATSEFSHPAVDSPPALLPLPHPQSEWQQLVYELAPLAYLNFDSRGRLLDFNLATARLLGVTRTGGIRRALADFVIPRQQRRILSHVRRSRTSRKPVITRVVLHPEGGDPASVTEVEISTRPVSEGLCYRTQLLPISGKQPVAWPDGDAKFRALVENSTEVICIGAPDGTIFYTTPSVRRVLGYEPASWFGRNAFEIMHQDHAEATRSALLQLAAAPTGSVIRVVIQVRHRDGSWRWVEGVITNLIGQPAIGGIVCNYRDITDSRNAEDALRKSEHRYRLLAESLPQMVSIRDTEGVLDYCNSSWCEYRSIDCAAALKHDWKTDVHPDDAASLLHPPWPDGVPRPWEAEVRVRRVADGAFRWHHVRVIPLQEPAGAHLRWLVISSDIHERKQAEQERERLLHQLERERSELAVQYAVVRVLAWATSIGAAAPHLLAAFCDQLGWQAGALWLVGPANLPRRPALSLVHIRQHPDLTPPGLLRRVPPTPIRKSQGLAGRVWAGKKPLHLASLSSTRGAPHHRAAASLGMRSAFAFPILLAGEVRGVVELFSREPFQPGRRLLDIVGAVGIQIGQFIQRTRALDLLRQSEEALIQVNNALEQRVRDRTAELHDANCELSAEIAERTRLEREIIRISEREQRRIGQDLHDGVCQELAAIAFMTRALGTRMGRNGAPESERVDHLAQLLNDSISRCRDIARGLHPVEMDADGLMVALKDLATRTTPAIVCTFACDRPIHIQESDIALNLYRVAQEAVNNAVKYSRASRITITLERKSAALHLSIADDGRGIPDLTPRTPPAGMGLHIMRYRARTMGATLRIRQCQPSGTEVLCILPRQ